MLDNSALSCARCSMGQEQGQQLGGMAMSHCPIPWCTRSWYCPMCLPVAMRQATAALDLHRLQSSRMWYAPSDMQARAVYKQRVYVLHA